MKNTHRVLLQSFVLTCAVSALAHPVTVSLSVEPEAELPGLYRFWRVTLKNAGGSTTTVPNKRAVQVTPATGSPSVLIRSFQPANHFHTPPRVAPIPLGAGQTRDLTFSLEIAGLLRDATQRLGPGTYRIQFVIDEALDSERFSGVTRVVGSPDLIDPIVSGEVEYVVKAPAGADLAVWNLLRDLDPMQWTGLAERIWRDYPDSRYAAEYVPHDRDPAKTIASYEAALRKNPHPDIAHTHRLILAQQEVNRGSALVDLDVEQAVAAYTRARKLLEEVTRHARFPHQIEAARNAMGGVYTREDIVRMHNAGRGIVESRFVPYSRCAETLPDGAYKVWFAYYVEGDEAFSFPLGAQNKFTPPPSDRGQPKTFEPGANEFPFSVVTSEPELTWHIGKHNIIVKARALGECPADELPDADPEKQ